MKCITKCLLWRLTLSVGAPSAVRPLAVGPSPHWMSGVDVGCLYLGSVVFFTHHRENSQITIHVQNALTGITKLVGLVDFDPDN